MVSIYKILFTSQTLKTTCSSFTVSPVGICSNPAVPALFTCESDLLLSPSHAKIQLKIVILLRRKKKSSVAFLKETICGRYYLHPKC
jgi:hypothetical protein